VTSPSQFQLCKSMRIYTWRTIPCKISLQSDWKRWSLRLFWRASPKR